MMEAEYDEWSKYEFHNYYHAIEVLSCAFPDEWKDIIDTLTAFQISESDLSAAGGSETNIPGKIDDVLYPRKWRNVQVTGELHVKFFERIIDRKCFYLELKQRESLILFVPFSRVDHK